MNNFSKTLTAGIILLSASSAQAGIINFIDLIENSGLGESAWSSLNLSTGGATVFISGHATGDDDSQQFAYLDWGNAGLGVCKDVSNPALVNVANPGSGANNCAPSSDDNITFTESLGFTFDVDVLVSNLWFNNNHDDGFGAGDQITIDGLEYDVATGYAGGANGIGSFTVLAGEVLEVAFFNEQFYMSAMEFNALPPSIQVAAPGSMAIFGLGLLGLAGLRRHKA